MGRSEGAAARQRSRVREGRKRDAERRRAKKCRKDSGDAERRKKVWYYGTEWEERGKGAAANAENEKRKVGRSGGKFAMRAESLHRNIKRMLDEEKEAAGLLSEKRRGIKRATPGR